MMERYYELGLEFATHFFTPKNGAFNFQTRRGEFTTDLYVPLLKEAQELGFVDSSRPIESIIYDIQVIVIGNVFEWCVFEGDADLMGNLARMLRNYLETCVFTEAYFKRYPRSSELTLL
jgi:hypothetical protein